MSTQAVGGALTSGGRGRARESETDPDSNLLDGIRIVSTCDHLIEPPDLFTSVAPSRYVDKVPRVIDAEGFSLRGRAQKIRARAGQGWVFDGRRLRFDSTAMVVGLEPHEFEAGPPRYEEIRRAVYEPAARVKDLDLDGIAASACFPFVIGIAGEELFISKDSELATWCIRVYNDYVLDEWCAAAPSRLIPIVILPLQDPSLAAQELERTIAKGARGVSFPINPGAVGLPAWHSDEWDPVLSVAGDASVPLCVHISTQPSLAPPDAPAMLRPNICNVESMIALMDILSSPIPQRHPKVRFQLAEGSIGWLPYVLEKLDFYYAGQGAYRLGGAFDPNFRPSSLVPGRIYGNFIEDYFGLQAREIVGVEQLTWQSDYPHADCSWPNSRRWLSRQFEGIPLSDARQILELTPCALFSFDLDEKPKEDQIG